jgi:hypothetical protein
MAPSGFARCSIIKGFVLEEQTPARAAGSGFHGLCAADNLCYPSHGEKG